MVDKKAKTTKKTTKKSNISKKASVKKNKVVKKAKIKEDEACLLPKKTCSHKCLIKFLLTVIISALVAIIIVVTTPLWMEKFLPAEKQPAFLRKALMPVTNVKVIKTKPLPNNVEVLIKQADKNLHNQARKMEKQIINKVKKAEKKRDNEIMQIKRDLNNIKEVNKYINDNWEKRSMQYKIFLVSFYNTYDKIMSGKKYSREMELMQLNIEPGMLIHKDLPLIIAYKDHPPRSLKNIGKIVEDSQYEIIAEEIRKIEKGLKQKLLLSMNYMFNLEVPIEKTVTGTLKHNLMTFINATRNDNECRAMTYGKLLANQSAWFKENIQNELEARWKINKQINLIKHNVEKEIYEDEISNEANNANPNMRNKYSNNPKK